MPGLFWEAAGQTHPAPPARLSEMIHFPQTFQSTDFTNPQMCHICIYNIALQQRSKWFLG